jgi:adenylate cyclase
MRALAAILLASLVAAFVAFTGVGTRLELATIDARYEQRGTGDAPAIDEVVVLEVDDATDAAVEQRWPYPRDMHADALDALAAAGARAVVLDVQFLDPSGTEGDDALVEALARLRERGLPVVLATAADESRGGLPLPFSGIDDARDEPRGTLLERAGAFVGRSDTDADRDGVVRRAPALRLDERMPSLAVAAVRAIGEDDPPAELDGQLLTFNADPARIARANYAAAILGDEDELSLVEDRVVFVGATSRVLHDLVRTPLDEAMPGVELHVHSFLDLRAGSGVREAPRWLGALVAGVLALVLVLLATGPLRRHIAWWTVLGLALPLAWVAFATWAFASRALVVPVAAPVLGAFAALVLLVVTVARAAIIERRHVAGVFSRYLAPRVVRQLLADDALDLGPGGTSAEITVLFTDVRGFTALSSRTDPDVLVGQLNELLEELVAAIDLHEGTVDKFLGDGMMAFFGAPGVQPDHAARAVDSAVEMLERVAQLNVRRAERGDAPLTIGIGIATGRVVVGNIGSTRRLEYTAIGNAVNLAARLESATKQVGVDVLLDEATASAVDEAFVERIGTVAVRGVDDPVAVATLARAAEAPPALDRD